MEFGICLPAGEAGILVLLKLDFLTAFPYWGILVLVILNAFLVLVRDVRVEDSDHKPGH